MKTILKASGIAAVFVLGSCSGQPPSLAFSSTDCIQIESSEDQQVLEELLRADTLNDFESVTELIAATNANKQSVFNEFAALAAGIDGDSPGGDHSAPAQTREEIETEQAALMARYVAAVLDPDLPTAATRVAQEIEAACGSSEVADSFFETAERSTFMQVVPTDEYCRALNPFSNATHSELKAAAPSAHQDWIDELGSARAAGEDSPELETILLYGLTHCS